MAIQLKSTSDLSDGKRNMLIYGQSGAGKTHLIGTCPNPVVLSAEAGLMPLKSKNISFIEINTIEAFRDAYKWALDSDEAKGFETICIDSISEIAEVCLISAKKRTKDPRQAYGEMQDTMAEAVRLFRDLPSHHVYMSAMLERVEDTMGAKTYAPSMPGNKASQKLPYIFDIVAPLVIHKNDDDTQRALMLESDGRWLAKCRDPNMPPWFEPDISKLIEAMSNV